MNTNFFKLSGVIGRTEYFKTIIILLVEWIVVTGVLSFFMDMQNAEVQGAPVFNQTVAIALFALLLLNTLLVFVVAFSAVIRRARDTGRVVLWTSLSILVPFVYILLGFIPRNRSN
jgi:uncharacterized membrane protein YhaH (DUF805 family)